MEFNQKNKYGENKILIHNEGDFIDKSIQIKKNKLSGLKKASIIITIIGTVSGIIFSFINYNKENKMNTFNQNNINGNNIMNFGSQPRELNSSLETQLKQLIPNGSSVDVTSVLGDGEAYNFASRIKEYLTNNGYKVTGVNQAVYSQPIVGQIIENPQNLNDSFKIIIGNKQ